MVLDDGTVATPTALPAVAPPEVVPDGLEIIWEAYSVLVREYVDRDALDPDKLAEAALRGMLDSLDDRHLAYIGPESFQIERAEFSGKFQGIGAHVEQTRDGRRVVIVSPIDGSPADLSGVKAGDIIMAVDGVDTYGWSVIDAVNKIRGPEGSPVVLTVQRIGESNLIDISIVRGTIDQPSVRGRVLEDDPYGVVHILMFTQETPKELRKAMDEILSQDVRGVVLDLRQNPGGLLTAVRDVASEFLDDGLVTYEIDASGIRDEWPVQSGGRYTDIPLVAIVDAFSASGSEVLAGALQDHQRAVVIGTNTFGKGSVNLLRELSNQGGLYFTIGRWYTPNGRQIESEGVEPDVIVKFPPKATEDTQLSAAIKQLDFQTGAAAAR